MIEQEKGRVVYNLVTYFMLLGIAVASMFSKKVRKMWRGERHAFEVLRGKVDPDARYIWFHAASLGEFEQGRPLMERIREEHPEYKILLTFFSPSGYEVRKNYKGADIICYMPVDTPTNAHRFLRLVHPEMAFFIKYEFWYNYLHILAKSHIQVYSVSSIFRPEQVFFKWYGRQYGKVLKCITRFFVQNEESLNLLAGIGLTNVEIVGDTRFDRVLQIKAAAKRLPIVDSFVNGCDGNRRQVFVAGSSWAPDEDIFISFFNQYKNWKLIIAPHVIGEDHLQQICSKLDRKTVRYTKTTPEEASSAECLIVDCFGLLSSIYHYGQISYVGGGFGVGIHNTLEAGVWGIPVIFGPNNKNFQEAQGLLKVKGGFEIKDKNDFAVVMECLTNDQKILETSGKKASDFVTSLAGATDKILKEIKF